MDKKLYNNVCIDVYTADSRFIRFIFPPIEKDPIAEKVYNSLETFAFNTETQYFFAFSHKHPSYVDEGWNLFNYEEDFKQLGINFTAKVI